MPDLRNDVKRVITEIVGRTAVTGGLNLQGGSDALRARLRQAFANCRYVLANATVEILEWSDTEFVIRIRSLPVNMTGTRGIAIHMQFPNVAVQKF